MGRPVRSPHDGYPPRPNWGALAAGPVMDTGDPSTLSLAEAAMRSTAWAYVLAGTTSSISHGADGRV